LKPCAQTARRPNFASNQPVITLSGTPGNVSVAYQATLPSCKSWPEWHRFHQLNGPRITKK